IIKINKFFVYFRKLNNFFNYFYKKYIPPFDNMQNWFKYLQKYICIIGQNIIHKNSTIIKNGYHST
ncbi:hypothetical protein NW50_14565, partial [Listeria monocytogenes]|nr:hypothetical protein [Listeria monocytogenes]MCM85634.1 hypothetical protein [Listeria monocytogenes]